MMSKMIIKPMWIRSIFVLIILCMTSIAYAQNSKEVDATNTVNTASVTNKTLIIGVKEAPPFAKIDDATYSGLAID